jgi:hypothetical protein
VSAAFDADGECKVSARDHECKSVQKPNRLLSGASALQARIHGRKKIDRPLRDFSTY